MGHGEWHCAQPVALGIGQQPGFAARETLPGRQRWNPAATGAGRIDGVAKVTGAKLYASDFRAADLPGWPAKTSHAMLIRARGRDACLHRHGPFAPERRAEAVGGGDRGRSRRHRHPRSRILHRRPVLPGRQDAALSRPAGRAADLRDVRRLRSGAAHAARCAVREVRRGDRSHRHAALRRVSLHAHRRARRPTRPMSIRRSRRAGSVRGASRMSDRPVWKALPIPTGARLCQSRDPMASRFAPSLQRTIQTFW